MNLLVGLSSVQGEVLRPALNRNIQRYLALLTADQAAHRTREGYSERCVHLWTMQPALNVLSTLPPPLISLRHCWQNSLFTQQISQGEDLWLYIKIELLYRENFKQ